MKEGKHIKIQVYGVDFEILKDTMLVEDFLLKTVHAAAMRELDSPHVYDIKKTLLSLGEEPDINEPEGVTGIIVLSTSHVAIHTWPHRRYAVIDLFSCRDFVTDDAMGVVVDIFSPIRATVHDLSFSLELP
jgi:S-adenosylmethionine/arginine decarboxylase-like enzyme